jgi:hypothetical protein
VSFAAITLFVASQRVMSRDSSVGTALGYGLDDEDSRVRFPGKAGNLSFHHRVQKGLGPTQPPI